MNASFTSILRNCTSALTALAFVAMVAPAAHAVSFTNAGITDSSTGELGNGSYSGVSNNFSSLATGYNFIFASTSVGAAGGGVGSGVCTGHGATCATDQYGSGAAGMGLWSIPTGGTGAFLALDSDYNTTGADVGIAVTESISGLQVGHQYSVTFDVADAQQNVYDGASEDEVTVCLSASSPDCDTPTGMVQNASEGSTAWVAKTETFTASAGTETLSFLASGGSQPTLGSNVPAFALVDNLAIADTTPPSTTPEPSSLMLLGTGLAGLSGFVRSRLKKS
jgi:hypothetical protein